MMITFTIILLHTHLLGIGIEGLYQEYVHVMVIEWNQAQVRTITVLPTAIVGKRNETTLGILYIFNNRQMTFAENVNCKYILDFCIIIPTYLGLKKNQYYRTSTLEIQMTIKKLLKEISRTSRRLTHLNLYLDRDHLNHMHRLQVLMIVCKYSL